jgi:DNA-binding CsgD family transcriptional regulator
MGTQIHRAILTVWPVAASQLAPTYVIYRYAPDAYTPVTEASLPAGRDLQIPDDLRPFYIRLMRPLQPRLEVVRGHAFDALTTREYEILQLLATGATNAQIAGALELSEGTIRNALARVTYKLRVSDRTQAALLAYRAGLATPGRLARAGAC